MSRRSVRKRAGRRVQLFTAKAPKPLGAYSQAIQAGGFVFCAGQIGVDPKSGELAGGSGDSRDIRAQTAQCLRNIEAVLRSAGCTLEDVVACRLFIVNMEEFTQINEEYSKFFPEKPPARTTVQVARLPKDAGIEIEAIALAQR